MKALSDPLGLYNANMGSHPLGGIARSGITGSFSYSVKSGYADMPVVFVPTPHHRLESAAYVFDQ